MELVIVFPQLASSQLRAGRGQTCCLQHRLESVAKWLAISLGLANAAVSAYWLAGGTALLSTVGGEIEEWGRRRTAGVLVVLAIVVVVKSTAAALPLIVERLRPTRLRRVGRTLAWVVAGVLTMYGGLLTVVGLMVQAGVVDASEDADATALAWHAYLWDPWFLAWGIVLGSWLWLSHHRPADRVRSARSRCAPTSRIH